jgi:D-serine deaminase-like pyridoxal phosphate-dependent protein
VDIGVRRSPLHEVEEVVGLVERVRSFAGPSFAGLLAYEAHVAGLGDKSPEGEGSAGSALRNASMRAMKLLVRGPIAARRLSIARALADRGIPVPLFNGGGTGSLEWSSGEEALTEVAAGSGFLGSHLFDRFRDIAPEPAACFALQVVRRPAAGYVTCLGGGFVASGGAGPDRLPVPYLPPGLRLLPMEGAGEVQTPLRVPAGRELPLGAPVFFRHAKAGELAEHTNGYWLVRGDRLEGRAATYRGLGKCFL